MKLCEQDNDSLFKVQTTRHINTSINFSRQLASEPEKNYAFSENTMTCWNTS